MAEELATALCPVAVALVAELAVLPLVSLRLIWPRALVDAWRLPPGDTALRGSMPRSCEEGLETGSISRRPSAGEGLRWMELLLPSAGDGLRWTYVLVSAILRAACDGEGLLCVKSRVVVIGDDALAMVLRYCRLLGVAA